MWSPWSPCLSPDANSIYFTYAFVEPVSKRNIYRCDRTAHGWTAPQALGAPLTRDPQGVANVRAYFEGLLDFDFRLGCFAANSLAAKHVIPAPALARVQD